MKGGGGEIECCKQGNLLSFTGAHYMQCIKMKLTNWDFYVNEQEETWSYEWIRVRFQMLCGDASI